MEISNEQIQIFDAITNEQSQIFDAITNEQTQIFDAITNEQTQILDAITNEQIQILDAIASGNTSILSKYSAIISEYFLQDIDCCYQSRYNVINEGFISLISYGPENESDYESYVLGVRFIIEEKIIDPNIIINNQLLICKCIESFSGKKFQHDIINILFDNTSADIIKNYRDQINRSILLYLSAKDISNISVEQFDSIFNRLTQIGIDLKTISNQKYYEHTFLNDVAQNLRIKYVYIALNVSHDPNYYSGNKCNGYQNTAMTLLYNYRQSKNIHDIDLVIQIIILLINNGLDINYTDSDGYNLMDYVYSYGWYNIRINSNDVNHNIFDSDTMYIDFASYLKHRGFSDQTTDHIHYLDTSDCEKLKYPDSKPYKLLFDNRYQKEPKKWHNILARLKQMKNQGEDFIINSINKYELMTVYEAILISGNWLYTPILECIKEYHNEKLKN